MIYLVLFAILTIEARIPLMRIDRQVRPLLDFDIVSKFEMISGKQKHESLYEAAPFFRYQNDWGYKIGKDEFIVRNNQTKTNFIYPGAKPLESHALRYHFRTLLEKIDSLSQWTIAIDNDGYGNFMIVVQQKLTKLTFKRTTGAEKILNKHVPNDGTDSAEFDVIISKVRSGSPSIEGAWPNYLADNINTMLLQNGAEFILEANIREVDFLKRYSNTKTAAYLMKISKDPDTLSYLRKLEEEKTKERIKDQLVLLNQTDSKYMEPENQCSICCSEIVKRGELVPCGHKSFCSDCLEHMLELGIKKCPLCRQAITEVKKDKRFSICNLI